MLLTAFPFFFLRYVKITQNYPLNFQKYWYYYKDSSGNFCYNEYRTTTKTVSTDYKLQEDDSWWNWQPLVPLLHLLQLCCCLLLAWPLAVWLWPQRRQTHQWLQQASKKKKHPCNPRRLMVMKKQVLAASAALFLSVMWWKQPLTKKKLRCKDFISVHKKKEHLSEKRKVLFFGICFFYSSGKVSCQPISPSDS